MNRIFDNVPEMPGRNELVERKRELSKYLKQRMYEIMLDYGEPLKQKQYADKLGFSPPVFNAYVTGSRMPEYDAQIRLATMFGEKIYDICGTPLPMPDDPYIRAVVKAMAELPEKIQSFIAKLTEAVKNNPGLIDSFPQLT